jgi:hypothetical protein
MTDLRRPWLAPRLGVLVGLSTSAYAVLLGTVTADQSVTDRSHIAARAPLEADLAAIQARHDHIGTALADAGARYAHAAASYAGLEPDVASFEDELARYAGLIAEINGRAAALPAHAPMQPVTRTAPSRPAAPPPAHATTGASGG